MTMLFDDEDARTYCRQMLAGREYWMFLADRNASHFLTTLEKRFYRGRKNAGFQILLAPGIPTSYGVLHGLFPIVFALKKHLPASKLAPLLKDAVGDYANDEVLAERDMLCLYADPEMGRLVVYALNNWLRSRDGEPLISGEVRNGEKAP